MLTKSFIIAALIAALMQCAPTASADDGGALHGGAHQGEAHQKDWAAALGSDLVRLGRIEWALRSAAVPH